MTTTANAGEPAGSSAAAAVPGPGTPAIPLSYSDLEGWQDADHGAALAAFVDSCRRLVQAPPHARRLGIDPADLLAQCRRALALPAPVSPAAARTFFESAFDPVAVTANRRERAGFFTGYFEPSVPASAIRTARFPIPLYRRPDDLVRIKDHNRPPGWDPELGYGRRTASGIEPYPDRAAIEDGLLAGRGLELAFVRSPVEAFFIHVQGSARLQMTDGTVLRLTFAAKTGHRYTSIGKLLAQDLGVDPSGMTMQVLRRWLEEHDRAGRALMRRNRSFIFFREADHLRADDGPEGAAGVPLRAGVSLAVDRHWHLFGTPVWVEVTPVDGAAPGPRRGLMIAQDTGSAIVGPTRADLFIGSGAGAGEEAGRIRHGGRFVVLWPKPATP